MSQNGTIKVQLDLTGEQAGQMRELARKIDNRRYEITFSQGAGAFVEEVKNMSCELKNIGVALSQLAKVTADRLDSGVSEFSNNDILAANQFSVGGGR